MPTINPQVIDGTSIPELEFLTEYDAGFHHPFTDYEFIGYIPLCYVFKSSRIYMIFASSDPSEYVTVKKYDIGRYPIPSSESQKTLDSSYTYQNKTVYYYFETQNTVSRESELPLFDTDINDDAQARDVFITPNYGKIAWAMIYGDVSQDAFPVTYSLSGCTPDTDNPTEIPVNASVTNMLFTANDGREFTEESVSITGTGYPEGEVQFNWNPETGVLKVGPVTSAIVVTVLAKVIDPYAGAGYSGEADGNGSFDFDGDNVTMSTLPTTSFTSTGFVRIYNPSMQQLSSLASYMWTDQTFVQTIINHAKQLLENPIESIISLNLLPCSIPNGTAEEVKVLFIPTGVYMPPVTAQFVEVDCGSVQLTETYGSALDYSPYTKVHCFLPYIGTVTLDTDEVMGKTISIKYRVDVATGVCVAHIMLNGDVYYQFSGHCAVAMPMTSADFSTYIAAAIGTAKAVAGVAAAGAGASGVAAALTGTAAPRSTTSKSSETERNPNTGRQITTGTVSRSSESRGATFGELAAKAVSNTVGAVMGSKMVVEHSGGFTGNSGYMGVRRPYIVVEIPDIANPKNYGKYNGYPSMITARIGDCRGYTEVQSVQLTGFTATNTELSQIGELLKAGVIL